ncbi:Vms1/Ankzf1 family peptidyl-tRNA hydrolase [Oerskovia flava]|uniref:baeRF2 domain-containing protein n=1 Tax=Oerskovia flava TaxID=2986422 RepID=UPI00223FA138|nr:Vms1/Ankzf1 family peptidyl-tRNA hydrolase [Oerskovia sp. JB1-3-2]
MKIDWLKPLLGRPGPFATVYIDATRPSEAENREVVQRWRGVRRSLQHDGAPAEVLDELEEAVSVPTRAPGAHGRVLIADDGGILVDRVLKDPPNLTKGVWGSVPALLQAARAADESVDYVRVVVDRQGADLTWSVAGGHVPYQESESVEGSHDVISKASSTSTKRATIESRVEDSWERNAETVATELERQVTEHRPELILLTGDVRAVSLLRGALSKRVLELVVDVPGGARGPGVNEEALEARIAEAVERFRVQRTEKVLADFRQEQGRDEGGTTELGDVVAVLRRGQVRELILSDEYGPDTELDGRTVWIGPDPLHIAVTRSELADLGVTDAMEELPATVGLVRAALGQDAGLTFAPAGAVELIDGVGAVLRWWDDGTPSEQAASMSGDPQRMREIV